MAKPVHMKLVPGDQPAQGRDNASESQAGLIPAADVSAPVIRKKRGGKIVLAFMVVIAGGVGAWWYLDHKSLGDTVNSVTTSVGLTSEPAPLQLAAIEVTTLATQTLTRTIRVSGSLAPNRVTTVNAEVGARIETIEIDAGDRVDQGQVIAEFATNDLRSTLDDRQAALAAAQSQVKLATSSLGKIEELAGKGYATRTTLEQSQNDVQAATSSLSSAESAVALARSALDDAVVRAPIRGVVSERMVNPGEAVANGTKIATIVDLSSMDVEVGIPTNRISSIAVGQSVDLKVEGIGDRTFQAKVTRINPVADAGTRTVTVYISLPNPDGRLSGGMFVTGTITVQKDENALALPKSAIREDAQGAFVFAIEDDAIVRKTVTLGDSFDDGNLVTLTDGVAAGETIIVAPLAGLDPGTAVTVGEEA